MSTNETKSPPTVVNLAEGETVVDKSTTVSTATPVEPTMADVDSMAKVSQRQIYQNVNNLCNTTLYVLTKGFYSGEVSHHVDTAKEFVKEIKKDVEAKLKALPNDK